MKNEKYDLVYIIGHSLGQSDWEIFDSIQAKRIICSYHEKEDYNNKVELIKEKEWNIDLVSDKKIFLDGK